MATRTDTSENAEVSKDRRKLFKDAMSGNWGSVQDAYRTQAWARVAKITRAKDTLLHLAVSEGSKDVVQELVNAIPATDDAAKILRMENEGGDTPLHLAAALGMVEVCTILASKNIKLIVEARNKNGETPLFVAARYGKKKAFFALQNQIDAQTLPKEEPLSYCRRSDGYTILHIAIYGEHFDIAFEILHRYPEFVNYNNAMGQSALHLLANKPSVFKSGNRIRRLDSLIYSCIIVDPLKVKYKPGYIQKNGKKHEEDEMKLPPNYKTCFDLFTMLRKAFQLVVDSFQGCWKNCRLIGDFQGCWKNRCLTGDEEDQRKSSKKPITQGEKVDKQSDHENQTLEIASQEQPQNDHANRSMEIASEEQPRFPQNYITCFNFFKMAMKLLFIILGIGIWRIDKIKRKKQKHMHACQLMDELVSSASNWAYEEDGRMPSLKEDEAPLNFLQSPPSEVDSMKSIQPSESSSSQQKEMAPDKLDKDVLKKCTPPSESDNSREKERATDKPDGDTPILIAAKMGILEMVKKILETFPVAVQDLDSNHKNIVLLAVEFRQPHVYRYMLNWKKMKETIFGRVDKDGNSALHLAATVGHSRPWMIPGAALQMQWEIRWYKYVKSSMEPGFFQHYNNKGHTPREIFTQAHEKLVKDGGKWLTNTSQSCSLVAALIATVAFASATTVPGGVRQSGFPTLEGQPAFDVFAVSALVALCFSVTSLVMFLSVLTSRNDEMDFERDLPVKLILGLTSLFMSIAAMLVSFCAGHFYVIENKLRYAAYPVYAITCLPITFFAVAQFPLYFDLIKATIARVPERAYRVYRF